MSLSNSSPNKKTKQKKFGNKIEQIKTITTIRSQFSTPRKSTKFSLLQKTADRATTLMGQSTFAVFEKGTLSRTINTQDPISAWCNSFPYLYFISKNRLTIAHINESTQTVRVVGEEDNERASDGVEIYGMAARSGDGMVALALKKGIQLYLPSFDTATKQITITDAGNLNSVSQWMRIHMLKFDKNLILIGHNNEYSIFDVENQCLCRTMSSKDSGYFLFGYVQDGKVCCATADSLYITVVDEGKVVEEVIVPLASPISSMAIHHNKIYCGLFDGVIRVLDGVNMGTWLYDLNHLPSNSEESADVQILPRNKQGVGQTYRIICMEVFGDFVVTASKTGECSVWGANAKFQHFPPVTLKFSKFKYVEDITVDTTGNWPVFSFLLKNESQYATAVWQPKIHKLQRILNETILYQYISKPKGGSPGILKEWRANTKGMDQEDFILRVQELLYRQYPYLSDCCESCTITNNTLPDNPIIFVNDTFQEMTGYSREEIVGRNCRFLQGKYTDAETVNKISTSLKLGKSVSVQILNYKKNGMPFWNVFVILPVYDEKESVLAFFAVQKNITEVKLSVTPVIDWLFHEVALWLETVGFGIYSQVFMSNKVDGRALLKYNEVDLVNLGVSPKDAQSLSSLLEELRTCPKVTDAFEPSRTDFISDIKLDSSGTADTDESSTDSYNRSLDSK